MQLLESILGSRNNIRVLRHLIIHENWEFNITELSKDININKGILSRLIKRLNQENIVKINKKGKILLFKINKENIIIKKIIIPLFKNENNFFNDFIQPRLNFKSKNILSVILYGSYANKNFKLTSDIDLLIITKNKENNLINEIKKLKEYFLENDLLLRIDIITLNEFKKLYKLKEPLIISIEKNNKILCGKNINELK